LWKDKIRAVWYDMKARCFNEKHQAYRFYGGRGITVHKDWLEYTAFKLWCLSNGYSNGLFIDRINNNGNYEPSNCRFVDAKTSANNRRSNKIHNFFDEMLTIGEAADKYGIPYITLHKRLRTGFSPEQAVTMKRYDKKRKRDDV
jgi:hypothetical protein